MPVLKLWGKGKEEEEYGHQGNSYIYTAHTCALNIWHGVAPVRLSAKTLTEPQSV